MPIAIDTKYKLKAKDRKALTHYLTGTAGITVTAKKMDVTRQQVYTMATVIFRHAGSTGALDIEAILKNY